MHLAVSRISYLYGKFIQMAAPIVFESSLRKLGLVTDTRKSMTSINDETYASYIRILYLQKGYKLQIDFDSYEITQPSLAFIGPQQYFQIKEFGNTVGSMIFYNRDFYCIQIHDAEVACDGLLFNHSNNKPVIELNAEEDEWVSSIYRQIEQEFKLQDSSQEEMIRTYLKQLLIRSTRIWKKQEVGKTASLHRQEMELFRRFSQLVDAYYREKHSVSDYAELLYVAPKTITHKFKRLRLPQPNDIIKNRIMLEAKRLLVHTNMTAKEIAYQLGYEDPAYFSRHFLVKTGESPSAFRTKYLATAAA